MSANFFKINRGINLDPQTVTGSGDPVGANGDLYYNDILAKFRKFENGSWSDVGSGGSGSSNGRSGNMVIPAAASSITVTFSSPMPSTTYTVLCDMVNFVDSDPQYQTMIVTNKTVNGFTAKWNAPTDSGNYSLDYIAPGNLVAAGEVAVPISNNSLVVTLSIPMTSTNYAVVAMLQDTVDAFPQFQTVLVSNKTNTSFTVKWNAPTDSPDYVLVYEAMGFA